MVHAVNEECPGRVEMPPNRQNGGGGAAASFTVTSGPRTNGRCSVLPGDRSACEDSSFCSRLLPLEGRVRVDDLARGLAPERTTRLGLAILPVEAARRRRLSPGCLANSLMGVPLGGDSADEEAVTTVVFVLKAPVRTNGWNVAVAAFKVVAKLPPSQVTSRPCHAVPKDATGRDASREPDRGGSGKPMFEIRFARDAYFKDIKVSFTFELAGEQFTNMRVAAEPPTKPCKSIVSLWFL